MSGHREIWYVYGIVRTSFDVARAPSGLDEVSVELRANGDLAALVSRLDGEQYAPERVERSTEDVEWLAPRAVAHDRILTWASDRGPVVPLPIFSLFSSGAAVERMLDERKNELNEALERAASGREYTLRVYRIDAELTKSAADLSPRLAELRNAAASASPGQRYLLERKFDSERKNELHAIGGRVSRDVIDSLRPLAIDTRRSRIAPHGARPAEAALILDAAFLVAPARLEQFQRELTDVVGRYATRGFRFEFTGPWPVYHFVHGSSPQGTDDT